MTNRLSIRAVSLGDDLRAIAPAAQRLGYAGVQLDFTVGALSLTELSASARREVRHLLASASLELDSLRGTLPADLLMKPAQHDRVLWMLKRAIDATAAIAASQCCIDLGRLPTAPRQAPAAKPALPASGLIIIPGPVAPAESEPPVSPEELAAWDGIDSILREAGSIADRAGVVLAFSTELSSFASLDRLLQGAHCPWFGVDLDPVSVLRDRWDLEKILDVVGGSLRHVRGRDAIRGSAGRTQGATIGQGSTNWQEVMAILDSGAYGGWIAVDTVDVPDRLSAARQAIGFLRSIR